LNRFPRQGKRKTHGPVAREEGGEEGQAFKMPRKEDHFFRGGGGGGEILFNRWKRKKKRASRFSLALLQSRRPVLWEACVGVRGEEGGGGKCFVYDGGGLFGFAQREKGLGFTVARGKRERKKGGGSRIAIVARKKLDARYSQKIDRIFGPEEKGKKEGSGFRGGRRKIHAPHSVPTLGSQGKGKKGRLSILGKKEEGENHSFNYSYDRKPKSFWACTE